MSFGDFVFACYLNIGKPSSRKQREARIKTCRRGYTSITLRVSIKWKCFRLEKHTTVSNAIAADEELLALFFMLFSSAIGRHTWWQQGPCQGGERRWDVL